LTSLLRRSTSEDKSTILEYLFVRLKSSDLPNIFGRGGIETNFIEEFLASIMYAYKKIEEKKLEVKIFLERSLDILEYLSKCNRFTIAKIFMDNKKVSDTIRLVEKVGIKNVSEEKRQRFERIINIWKS